MHRQELLARTLARIWVGRVIKINNAESTISPLDFRDGSSVWNLLQAHMAVPSLGHLCLLSKWKRRISSESARGAFWNWLFDNQNLLYKQRTIRYCIEAYATSTDYLDFVKDLKPGLLRRQFWDAIPSSPSALYRQCEWCFLEAIQHAINDGLHLVIGSETVEFVARQSEARG